VSSARVLARAGIVFAVAALVALLLTALVGTPALVVALVCALVGAVLSGLAYRSQAERALALVGLVPSIIEVIVVIAVLLLVTPTSVHRQ
jgi:hypothetical protein